MKPDEAVELALHRAALAHVKAQRAEKEAALAEAKAENTRLRGEMTKERPETAPALERKLMQLEQAVAAYGTMLQTPAVSAPVPVTYYLNTTGNQDVGAKLAKAGPDPRVIRDAVLAGIQKNLVQRLKKFFQGLQLQALRILRAETGETEADRLYWEEPTADGELASIVERAFGEVGAAAFNAASKEYGVPVAWTAENFWLPQYIGIRTDLIKGIDANLKAELIAQLREGYAQGEGIPKLSQRVTEVFREAIDWKAERISRTETLQAYAAASLAAYQAGGIEKVQMHDGPHDDQAHCKDVDGLVVSIAEATQLMAEEHPNGVRAVAPFTENLLMPNGKRTPLPTPAASSPPGMPLEFLGVQAMAFALEAQRRDQQLERVLQQNQNLMETIKSLALSHQPPDITIDQPPPPPINVHVTIPEGAIKVDSPVTVHPSSVNVSPAEVNIAEGAIRVDSPVVIPKGMIENSTPITVMMPQPPEVVFEETTE